MANVKAPTPTEGDASPAPSSTAPPQSDNVAHALAGAGGGLLSMTLTYPLITLSTRAQVESKKARSSTFDAAKKIIQREGWEGLFSGLGSALFGISITNFVYYYWYEYTRTFLEAAALRAGRLTKRLTTPESILCGAIAGSFTVLLTNPIWVVNTRMTARSSEESTSSDEKSDLPTHTGEQQRRKKPSTISTLIDLVRNEGFSALFAGVLPALVLVINPILQYTIFEQLRNVVEKRRKLKPLDAFFLGAIGKAVATGVTYPYITVKSRMHVAKKEQGQASIGMIGGLKSVVNEQGYSGLYNGIGPKISQSVITAAFLFAFKDVLYEMSTKLRTRAKTLPLKR